MGRGFTALSDGKTEASTSRRSEVPHTDAILRYEGSTVVYSASRRLHQFVVDGDMDISQQGVKRSHIFVEVLLPMVVRGNVG